MIDVSLEFVNDNTGTLITRLSAEAKNPQADVFFGALGELDGTAYHEHFQQYSNIYAHEAYKQDQYGYYNYFTIAVNALMINPDLKAELGIEINSLKDLLQPELKGKIANMNPNTSSSSFRSLVTMLYTFGADLKAEGGWSYVDGLIENMDGIYAANLPSAINNGEYVVAVFYEDSALSNRNDGMNIEVIYPSDGNIGIFIGCAMVKNCPNEDGARAVIDYICSAEYQTRLMEDSGAFRPANANVTYQIEGMPGYDSLPLVDVDIEAVIDSTQEIYDHWNELWYTHNG